MFLLASEMCAALGLPEGARLTGLFSFLQDAERDYFDGLITTEQGRLDAEHSFEDRAQYVLHLIPQIRGVQERHCSLNIEGSHLPVLIGLISDQPAQVLPTALERLVFWALIEFWQANWKDGPEGPISDWRDRAKGMAIVALPTGVEEHSLKTICALFGLRHMEICIPAQVPPLVPNATVLSVRSKQISSTQARLLSEAGAVQSPKWRCLSLYRILEHAYLNNIKQMLLADFDADASRAVDKAKAKLASELSQLVALAEEAALKSEFEEFDIAFQGQLTANNRFLTALDKAAEQEGLYKSKERFKKAVLRFYKLRCSIAHAGTSSVIYEQFPDADQGVSALLASVESIALKSFGVQVTA